MQSITPHFTFKNLESLTAIRFHAGNKQASVQGISTADAPKAKTLVFASDKTTLDRALSAQAEVVVALAPALHQSLTLQAHQLVLSTDNISEAMAQILPYFDGKKNRWTAGISTKASIAPSAKLGKNVTVGDFTVIGENVVIGDSSILGAHVTIEASAKLGADCYIHPQVVIGERCELGERCEIHSNTTLGSDGFAFYTLRETRKSMTASPRPLKIPQVGIVVLEDDVEIGSSCSIDRATLTETRIGAGTKIDNQVHIAHNVKIGKDCRITAGLVIAGSSEIGDRFLCGGNTSITDHVKITDDVMLAGRSAVTNDITKPGAYGGYPIEPLREAMKTIANLAHITTMRKQLHQIRKHLGLKDD